MTDTTRQRRAQAPDALPRSDNVSQELPLAEVQTISNMIRERVGNAWPKVNIPLEPFVQRFLSLIDRNASPLEGLKTVVVEDLFLAYACAQRAPAALDAFAKECDTELKAVASRLKISYRDLDDVRQRLWDKLLLDTPERTKKILEYRGKGRLRHWFRVVAARAILDDLRKARRSGNHPFNLGDHPFWQAAPDVDPELDNIRRQYKDAFRTAFENAVCALEPEERNILRCHYLMGMSTEQLAQAFGVHKATAARRISRARDRLLELTRDGLKAQLGMNSGELDSVMRLFDGEMSITLSKLLD
jgi:RNA polymerase sigma-70 factor (ECF subfamily)